MVFSSLLFLFVFLSISMGIYMMVPKKYHNMVLLISSLVFYAWGGVRYLFLLLGETAISWFCALQMKRNKKETARRFWMIAECICLLGLLGFFKYMPLLSSTIAAFTGSIPGLPEIVLPIGISFYTFQLLSYVIDVYRKEVSPQPSYWKLLLYSSLFHQCIAGPIVRYQTVADEIDNRRVNTNDIYAGIRRFSIGLAKKAILANGISTLADSLASTDASVLSITPVIGVWVGVFAYMLQLYLDFSAYSDMAIGMGRMVGFHYLENFNYPYMATSVQDFWRRWHISLSSFFRDYVYIPLGGSRGTIWVYVRNILVVWFLTGMWHGAAWNYILWGLYYAVFLLLERFVIRQKIPNGWNRLYTLSVVFFGWLIFRFEDWNTLIIALRGLVGLNGAGFFGWSAWSMVLSNLFLIAACVIACTSLSVWIERLFALGARQNEGVFVLYCAQQMLLPLVLLFLSFLALIGDVYNPFLYFQF